MRVDDLSTPALLVDADAFSANVARMAAQRPGGMLRPHVKAFKSTALAAELVAAGHDTFCGATARELLGMAAAGLGDDLLLANELVDPRRLQALAACGARVSVAVDSAATVAAAAAAGIREVLVDVAVGMPRCGCPPGAAGRLAELARRAGLEVRGVMGYEGHLMTAPAAEKAAAVEAAMARLLEAHDSVGGDIVSGGGTGTYATNQWVTELQAGSYTLMDTHYAAAGLPFRHALSLLCTVISVDPRGRWAVCDAGLKALGMDHGDPTLTGFEVLFCSDEHTTFAAHDGARLPKVGDRLRMLPAHVDPTVAYHESMHVIGPDDDIIDTWAVDLRGW
ncbi:MAG: alanine racemase [Actinobacteria bacterium]|nr:alanine racemase [Actinomycetota bacterium]